MHIGGYEADNSLQVGTRLTPFIQWFTETVLLCRLYSVTRPLPSLIVVPPPNESETNTSKTSLQVSADSERLSLESNDGMETALVIPRKCQQLFDSMKMPMVDDAQARALAACISLSFGYIDQVDETAPTTNLPYAFNPSNPS